MPHIENQSELFSIYLSTRSLVLVCRSMYEVAPYTSNVVFTLVAPGKQHMKHATPQIYARFHAYPTLSEYDVTTAVNGNEWKPAVAVTLPKSGTWYVCVHVHRLVHKESLPVAVQVNAQVLPHNECVERTHVSPDGQHVEHTTSCQNEVEKLQVGCPCPRHLSRLVSVRDAQGLPGVQKCGEVCGERCGERLSWRCAAGDGRCTCVRFLLVFPDALLGECQGLAHSFAALHALRCLKMCI